jgi:hypothetical protein
MKRDLFSLELYIKNKEYVHAALELVEVNFIIKKLFYLKKN